MFFIPFATDLVEHIVDNMVNVEQILWNKELPWYAIKGWNVKDPGPKGRTWQEKFGISGSLYLQYTVNHIAANQYVIPTSFVIDNGSLANEIFGFSPMYVNYNNDEGFGNGLFYPVAQSNEIEW